MPNPRPVISVDGIAYECTPVTDDTGRTVLAADRPTLIEATSITWGRSDVWTQPAPAVLTFTLWEPQPGDWLPRIVAQTALRRPTTLTVDKPGDTLTLFDGFTTNVDIAAERRRTPLGLVDGWRVQIQASDRSAFLDQIRWGAQTLPEQTMQNRAVALRNRAAPTGIRQFYFEDAYRTGQVTALDVTDKTVGECVTGMYTSFADQWTYNPARNVVIRIPSGSNFAAYSLKFGRSSSSSTVRLYPPYWIDPTGNEAPVDREPYPGGYIGACDVTGPIVLSADSIQDITHVVTKWFDKPNNRNWVSTIETRTPAPTPTTTLQFDSWYNDGTVIDPVMQDVKRACLQEGSRPVHPQIVWDTKASGPIPDWETFENLTLPAQTIRMVVLAGSPFSAATGYSPVWHPSGGVIAYDAGHWRLSINLSPTQQPLASGFKPVTCSQLAGSTSGKTVTLGDLDRSITCFDLQWINDPAVYAKE